MNAPFRAPAAESSTPFETGMSAGYARAGYCAAEHALTALDSAINSMETAAELGRPIDSADLLADRARALLARLDALAATPPCRALKRSADALEGGR